MKTLRFVLLTLLLVAFCVPCQAYQIVRHGPEPETLVYNKTAYDASTTPIDVDANIKAIKYGSGITLSSVTAKISTVAGTAFLTQPSVDLRPYVGFKISILDGTYTAVGWGKGVGTGETYGSEIVTNGSFDSDTGWTKGTGWSISGGVAVGSGTTAAMYQNTLDGSTYAGRVIRGSFDLVTVTASNVQMETFTTTVKSGYKSIPGTYVFYGTITGSSNLNRPLLRANNSPAFSGTVDNVSAMGILTPSNTGITICDSQGSTTQSFSSVHASFNPNATSFTITVTRN